MISMFDTNLASIHQILDSSNVFSFNSVNLFLCLSFKFEYFSFTLEYFYNLTDFSMESRDFLMMNLTIVLWYQKRFWIKLFESNSQISVQKKCLNYWIERTQKSLHNLLLTQTVNFSLFWLENIIERMRKTFRTIQCLKLNWIVYRDRDPSTNTKFMCAHSIAIQYLNAVRLVFRRRRLQRLRLRRHTQHADAR